MNQEKKIKTIYGIIGIVTVFLLVLLDQFTKYLAVENLKGKDPIRIITNVFELRYLENHGAAFGILQGKKTFFIISTVIISLVLVYIYFYIPVIKRYHLIRVVLLLFISGAIGNFIDRCLNNYVTDFFYFKLIDFPIFNVADIYVTMAAATLILTFIFYYKEEDMDKILPNITIRHSKR